MHIFQSASGFFILWIFTHSVSYNQTPLVSIKHTYFSFPVLYSLFAVTAIFMWLWPVLVREHLHTMEVNWANDNILKKWKVPPRQYLVVTFTGDTATDRIKMNFGRLYVRDMLRSKDTVHAIDFHFGDSSRYSTFVGVLSICWEKDAKLFPATDSGIKVLYWLPRPRHVKKEWHPTYL